MPILTETTHAGEHVLSEGNGSISREEVTITGSAEYVAGQVLGKVANGAATPAAAAGNTGDGTIGTVTVGSGAKEGVYTLTIIEPETNLGDFIVEDPDGVNVGSGKVGTAFSGGGLSFTLADGAADFVAGDQFAITVAEGSGSYTAHDPAATDGSEVAAAVLYAGVDATDGDVQAVANVRDTEAVADALTWKTGISAPDKAAGIASLGKAGIIVR